MRRQRISTRLILPRHSRRRESRVRIRGWSHIGNRSWVRLRRWMDGLWRKMWGKSPCLLRVRILRSLWKELRNEKCKDFRKKCHLRVQKECWPRIKPSRKTRGMWAPESGKTRSLLSDMLLIRLSTLDLWRETSLRSRFRLLTVLRRSRNRSKWEIEDRVECFRITIRQRDRV